jgi:V/A-type H+/Na+-transporting ATPase subunit E
LGLKEMSEEILDSARAEASRMEKEGEKQGKLILSEAEASRKKILENARVVAESTVESRRNEMIAAAHLEAGKTRSHAKETAIASSLQEILKATEKARDRSYRGLLKRLIEQGLEEVGKKAVVRVNKKDSKLAASLGFKVSDEPLDCIGGALVSSSDGRVIFNNTFEARFERRKESLRSAVHNSLFCGKTRGKGGGK